MTIFIKIGFRTFDYVKNLYDIGIFSDSWLLEKASTKMKDFF